MWAALITSDDPSTPKHLEHLSAMEQLASTCIRLANDLQSYHKEVNEGKINALVILSRELRAAGVPEEAAYQQAEARVQADIVAGLDPPKSRAGIPGAPYDAAWLAGLPDNADRRVSRFPTTLRWLADNQLCDGSWGSPVRYEHDRILCTLASIAPLAEFGRRAEDRRAVEAGTRYLWQHGHLLGREPVELVGFELLLPALVQRARGAGVVVPPHLDIYAAERTAKLNLIPKHALYSPRATVVHSLEFLGEQADLAGLKSAQGANGAIGNSPAATAFFLGQTRDDNRTAPDYLERRLGLTGAV